MEVEILITSLSNTGVPIPEEVRSVSDLKPESLVSICGHSINMITGSERFPVKLPEAMADRFKLCRDLSEGFGELGFIGDISFHKFLYPSEEDMYKLIRFLVGRLSESSRTAVLQDSRDVTSKADATVDIKNLDRSVENGNDEGSDLPAKVGDLKLTTDNGDKGGDLDNNGIGFTGMENGSGLAEEIISQEESPHKLEQASISIQDKSFEKVGKTGVSKNQENVLFDEVTAKSLELQQLQEQHDLLKTAVEMACDEQTPFDSYITRVNEKIDAKRHNLAEMESKWKATIWSIEEKKRNIEDSLFAKQPESEEKHRKWKKLEQDLELVLSETKQREKDVSNLSTEVEKLPKMATRRSYVERIKEITKNSRKQDIDIERILKETRELQLESNMIQERLHRTYAVVDETLLREARKDQVGEQAHNLLTTIHESFEEISEKILATDRTRREATDLETKLSSISARSLNVEKLQTDLDAIRKENEYLQSHLGNP